MASNTIARLPVLLLVACGSTGLAYAQQPSATGTRPAITLVSMDRSQKSPLAESPSSFGVPTGIKPCKPGSTANELLIIKIRAPRRFDVGLAEVTSLTGTKYRQLCSQLLDFSDGHFEGALVFDVPIGTQVSTLSLVGQEFDISKLGKTVGKP